MITTWLERDWSGPSAPIDTNATSPFALDGSPQLGERFTRLWRRRSPDSFKEATRGGVKGLTGKMLMRSYWNSHQTVGLL
jgi:hypothetical protein